MTDSILTSTKKNLGLDEAYTAFDQDVILHINSVFSTLQQLGVLPGFGYTIAGATETWADLLGNDPRLNAVKTYTYLRVRMLFDPPNTGFLTQAFKEQILELEWRLNVVSDELNDEIVLDGGSPGMPTSSLIYDGGTP